jgi:3-methyladenine DNA glycosylase AlkC
MEPVEAAVSPHAFRGLHSMPWPRAMRRIMAPNRNQSNRDDADQVSGGRSIMPAVKRPATRGARHPDLVPRETLALLEAGGESTNHMEQIALDMGALMSHAFPSLRSRSAEVRELGLVARMRAGGRVVYEEFGLDVLSEAVDWPSDTTRGWAAMSVGCAPGVTLGERLSLIRAFADDPHFAVREWAWLSLRQHVVVDLTEALSQLLPWVSDPSERVRRFASEVTRPRGVWSVHIPELKRDPGRGLCLLEPMRADDARYVQNSVGNWLNDAAKSEPEWVRSLCARWSAVDSSAAVARICRRAQRSLTVERNRPTSCRTPAGP